MKKNYKKPEIKVIVLKPASSQKMARADGRWCC